MSNFQSATGLLSTAVYLGFTLGALKITTDLVSDLTNRPQKMNKRSPKPFRAYASFDDQNYYGYAKKKRKSQNIFAIDF